MCSQTNQETKIIIYGIKSISNKLKSISKQTEINLKTISKQTSLLQMGVTVEQYRARIGCHNIENTCTSIQDNKSVFGDYVITI